MTSWLDSRSDRVIFLGNARADATRGAVRFLLNTWHMDYVTPQETMKAAYAAICVPAGVVTLVLLGCALNPGPRVGEATAGEAALAFAARKEPA